LNIQAPYEFEVYNTENFHTAIKPYLIKEIKDFAKIDSGLFLSGNNRIIRKLLNYNLGELKNLFFSLSVNPLIQYNACYDTYKKSISPQWEAGVKLEFNIQNKITISGNLSYVNLYFPSYYKQKIDTSEIIPQIGRFRKSNNGIYSVLRYTGNSLIQVNKYFNVDLGYDKIFFGDGYRSLFLSDNAPPYPFLRFILNIWKLKYVCMYSVFEDVNINNIKEDLLQKYANFHFLSWNVTNRLNIQFFEMVMYNPRDSLGNRGIELNYLNPVIFIRPVEFSLGSPDNVLMGFGAKLKFLKYGFLYTQILIDDFKIDNFLNNPGWWANKYAVQFGYKIFNFFGFDGLYWQFEFNSIRPFTYSHQDSYRNYGQTFQALAHPSGSNLNEIISIFRFTHNRSSLWFKSIYSIHGADIPDIYFSYGGNIYKSYKQRISNNSNYTGQGFQQKMLYSELKWNYLINPKWPLFFETGITNRFDVNNQSKNSDFYFFIGFATSLFNKYVDYQ
jgi:hypothetical protein